MQRKYCLIDNKELMNAVMKLKEELFKDFSKNLLERCDSCTVGLDKDITNQTHNKLINVYNELSDVKKLLDQ